MKDFWIEAWRYMKHQQTDICKKCNECPYYDFDINNMHEYDEIYQKMKYRRKYEM